MIQRDDQAARERLAAFGLISAGVAPLLNPTGRVDPHLLAHVVASIPVEEFAQFMRRPVLAGSGIQPGSIEQTHKQVRTTNQTFIFELSDQTAQDTTPEALKRAIYPLVKKRDAVGTAHLLTIGRISDNDLVIPDVAISKQHAIIEITDSVYSIRDRHSTNGTRVNHTRLQADPLTLNNGDIIAFARYEFVFLTPEALYMRLGAAPS
jgi:hypothetical protein